jgi:hypothetical protein
MAEYDPPIYDVPVFNPAFFINENEITKSYLRANFLEFPIGQGLETLPDLRVENQNIHLGSYAGLASQGSSGVAIGNFSGYDTQGGGAVAIGIQAGQNSQGANSVAIGAYAGYSGGNIGANSVAIGNSSRASGEDSIAIGNSATTSTFDNAVAIGDGASATERSICIGQNTISTGVDSVVIGTTATSGVSTGAVCIGNDADATGDGGIAIGESSIASANFSTCVGKGGEATAENACAFGRQAEASGIGSIALGFSSLANSTGGICIGNVSTSGITNRCAIAVADDQLVLSGYSNGTMNITTGNRVITSSDRRLKRDITYYDEPSIEKIMKLKPAYYYWKDDNGRDEDIQLGFIAQDVETIIPEAVDGKKYEYKWLRDIDRNPILDASGNLQFTDEVRHRGFSDRPLIAVLVKAFQEQQEQINQLKERISYLNV